MSETSFNLKLARAREHLDVLNKEILAWVETKPCLTIDEPDPEPPPEPLPDGYIPRRIRIQGVAPVPQRLSILVRDSLFNLRASLDHIALALALSHTPGMNPKQVERSGFPIFKDLAGFNGKKEPQIGCTAPDVQAIIESLQPYHCGNGYLADPLWQLHELNNIDKHRFITVLNGWMSSKNPLGARGRRHNVTVPGYFISAHPHLDFTAPKIDTVFARWSGLPKDPTREMYMDFHLPLQPTFESENAFLNFQPVIEVMAGLFNFVRDAVIAPLSKFLQ